MVYPYKIITKFSNKNEWSTNAYYSMNETWKHKMKILNGIGQSIVIGSILVTT